MVRQRRLRKRFLIALLTALALLGPAAADPVLYGGAKTFAVYSELPLSALQAKQLRQFRAASGYFGALYINKTTDSAFKAKNFHTFQAALLFAEGGCRLLSEGAPDDCVLYATITPKGFLGQTSAADGLSQEAERFFEGDFRAMQRSGRFGALAVSGMTALGWSSDSGTKAEAEQRAIAKCDQLVGSAMKTFGERGRAAVQKSGLDDCRILMVVTGASAAP